MPYLQQEILRDGDGKWNRVPYQVILSDSYATMTDNIKHMMASYSGALNGERTDSNVLPGKTVIDNLSNDDLADAIGMHPEMIGKTFFQDTRLGANDAINCLWQFNRDDDILYPSLVSSHEKKPYGVTVRDSFGNLHQRINTEGCFGEGRVYNSTTQRNQSIAYFSFGIPMYTDIAKFLANASDKGMSEVNAKGYSDEFKLGRLFGKLGMLAFPIIFIPLKAFQFAQQLALKNHVNKFYDFKRTMQAYYSFADSICAQWLVATGLYDQGSFNGAGSGENGTDEGTSLAADTLTAIFRGFKFGRSDSEGNRQGDTTLPPALRATGPSIFDIISLKARVLGFDSSKALHNYASIQEFYEAQANDMTGGTQTFGVYAQKYGNWAGANFISPNEDGNNGNFTDVLKSTMAGATLYVGFRIEKSVSASESFNNSAGPSALAEKVNGAVQGAHDSVLMKQASAGDQSDMGLVGKTMKFLEGAVSSISETLGFGDTASAVMMGALYDIPEEYKSSDFNKSHSLSFQLRAPYGDIVTIYQTIIVPLALILAGALPRAAGRNSYQQPFLCECYCKGIFSVPMGLIESVSLERGASEFGWTYKNLPTCVNVSLSVKDLSPVMYMTMRGKSISDALFSDDSAFDEYLNTLAGVGTYERISGLVQFRRRTQLAMHTLRNQIFNPNYWASSVGLTDMGLTVGGIFMNNRIPKN